MALNEMTKVFLCYDLPGRDLWHARLVLAASGLRGWYAILTPTLESYMEFLSLDNADIRGLRICAQVDVLPYGLDVGRVFDFQVLPDGAQLQQFLLDARLMAFNHGGPAPVGALGAAPASPAPGAAAGVLAPAGPPGLAAGAAPPAAPRMQPLATSEGVMVEDPVAVRGTFWSLETALEGYSIGDIVDLPPGAFGDCRLALGPAPLGSRFAGLVRYRSREAAETPRAAASVEDLRTLPVHFDVQGARVRTFAHARYP